MLQIGEVAKRVGVSIDTIRFYEREGLIPEPNRSPGGYRRYPESIVKQLFFIQHAKTLGFSLKEIIELMALKNTPKATCQSIKETAQAKVNEIHKKIEGLEKIKKTLMPLIDQRRSADPISKCPILGTIDEELR